MFVNSESTKIERTFTIKSGKLEIEMAKNQAQPHFNRMEDAIFVFYNNNSSDKLELKFKNETVTFFSYEGEEKNFTKLCNISQLEEGDYSMELVAGEENYTYFFEVR